MESIEEQTKTKAVDLPVNGNARAGQYRPPLGYADLGRKRGTGSAQRIWPRQTHESASSTEYFVTTPRCLPRSHRRRHFARWLWPQTTRRIDEAEKSGGCGPSAAVTDRGTEISAR